MKAHVAVDVETLEVLTTIITDDTVGDSRVFVALMRQLLARSIIVRRVLADGDYDTRGSFDLLRERGIEAGIKIKRSASMRLMRSSLARPRAVQELNRLASRCGARSTSTGSAG